MNKELVRPESIVDIASFSFSVGKIEQVGLSKVFTRVPYTEKPDSYSVSWTEWLMDTAGDKIQAEVEVQIQKVKKIQKVRTWREAMDLFLKKVTEHLNSYPDNGT